MLMRYVMAMVASTVLLIIKQTWVLAGTNCPFLEARTSSMRVVTIQGIAVTWLIYLTVSVLSILDLHTLPCSFLSFAVDLDDAGERITSLCMRTNGGLTAELGSGETEPRTMPTVVGLVDLGTAPGHLRHIAISVKAIQILALFIVSAWLVSLFHVRTRMLGIVPPIFVMLMLFYVIISSSVCALRAPLVVHLGSAFYLTIPLLVVLCTPAFVWLAYYLRVGRNVRYTTDGSRNQTLKDTITGPLDYRTA
jgi:hypothetical protein